MKTRSIWQMLHVAHEMIGSLSKSDADFIRNCYDTVQHNKDTSRLSSKQVEIISEIFVKHFA